MKPQDIQMVIKLARRLIGYAKLEAAGNEQETNYQNSYLSPKLGVISDNEKIEIWLKRSPDEAASADSRVFYARNIDDENYMVLVYRHGLWTKYLHQLLQDKEKQGYAAIDDAELFADINY